ncbi:MAG: anti-sigma factor antagonist [Acidimicrobiaceae bacterium]|jgi:anti-sigma B factor antagonist|nr:anti-sigma factor antagonist [Acidimicrobiaceae bacterium]MDQ1365905.1 anti-sigma factor antagonist [Acidimicrobiaceae bacterium]MDQ1368338.1 anti-sigma factor antagonist [Acidimicrobiaceae bacterium]MDQ1377047.1 anti-sigma factor antagonist [Acidimicrobiaceae bacterium]MDQ1413373.1 anti-sigma factor antagonist [Acidimicrobiaceae bacterium]
MPPELGLDVAGQPDYTMLTVEGEVDVYTAPLLRQKLVELADSGVSRIIVNLEAVEFLDSTGLGVLVAALNRLRRQDGDVELICSQARILRVFEITGLTKVFTIHQSLDAVSSGTPA